MDSEAPSTRPSSDGVLLMHTTLAALTPLIPLPFVDSAVKGYVMRRMVRSLAELHHLRIWDEEVKALVDDESSKLLRGFVKGAMLAPLKMVLRKTFMVLAGKRIVDLASESYHRGWLIDRTFTHGWCEPAGPRTARQVRVAIDEIVREVPVARSPVTRAFRIGFERSQETLSDAYKQLRNKLSALRGEPAEEEVARAVEEIEADERVGIEGIVEQLRSALTDVPREHFDELDRQLRERLEP